MDATVGSEERTVICSVVFLDIVGYSKEVVAQQMAWKRELNTLMSTAVSSIPTAERIILDTGDGAALCFLTDPEIALVVALHLVENFSIRGREVTPALRVRTGINLGSVKVVRDINGQPNVVGEGINVAQRIMSFAEPGQLLASRSFFEMVACLTLHYQRLFVFHGTHPDKHGRTHEVYAIEPARLNDPLPEVDSSQLRSDEAGAGGVCELVLAPEVLAPLEALLSRHVGPMASMVVQKVMKSVPNLLELCTTLAEQIPRAEERDRFLREASAILSKVPSLSATPLANGPPSAPQQPGVDLDERTREVLESELARQVGPIAKVLLSKSISAGGSLSDVVRRVAQSIPHEGERAAFEKCINAKLFSL